MMPRDYIEFLVKSVSCQRTAQRIQLLFAVVIIVLGLCIIVVAHLLAWGPLPEEFRWVGTLGGTFLGTLSGFPLNELLSRRTKITSLEFLCNRFRSLERNGDGEDEHDVQRLVERFWKLVDANLGT